MGKEVTKKILTPIPLALKSKETNSTPISRELDKQKIKYTKPFNMNTRFKMFSVYH